MPHPFKKDFPIFKNQPDLVYLDSTATALKPQVVLDAMQEYYAQYSANVSRGIYPLAEKATAAYEAVREQVAKFIGGAADEVIFVRGTTEGINLVASTWGQQNIAAGDEIVTTILEHHANFVPWQQLAQRKGAEFTVIDIEDDGTLALGKDFVYLPNYITPKTKLLALTLASNTLGTINPVAEIIRRAKKINPQLVVVVDAAQAAPHMAIDVQQLGCDFLVFSGHKMLGPTGIGVLWGKRALLEVMPPYQFGGDMISVVHVDSSTFSGLPHKFEAGTPHIAGVIGLGAAIGYLQKLGWERIMNYELRITNYALEKLHVTFGERIRIFGPSLESGRGAVISFTLGDVHPHDIAQVLGERNICIRAGHHCTMPLHTRLCVPATARASFYFYNDEADVDKLVEGLEEVEKLFGKN